MQGRRIKYIKTPIIITWDTIPLANQGVNSYFLRKNAFVTSEAKLESNTHVFCLSVY